MTRQEWFGLGVRLVGLWHLAYAGQYIATAMDVQFDLLPDSYDKRLGVIQAGRDTFFIREPMRAWDCGCCEEQMLGPGSRILYLLKKKMKMKMGTVFVLRSSKQFIDCSGS